MKGKSGKGGGKKGKSKDAGALVWNQQPSPVASSVASSTPQIETSTTVGTVDAIECTALDLCATQCGHWSRRNCVVNERGLRV